MLLFLKGEIKMNKYLIKDIDVDINLECDDDIYYPTEVI